jgi:hypothetical protein
MVVTVWVVSQIVGKPLPDGSGCQVWALAADGSIAQEVHATFEGALRARV